MLRLNLWDDLRLDLRYAMRMLIKSPGLTAIILGSLALGIGANTAIFTAAKQVLFDRLAVPHPEQLQLFTWTAPTPSIVHHLWNDPGPGGERTAFPYPVYQQLRNSNQVLSDLFAFKNVGRLSANIEGEAVAVQVQMVSGNYYEALEVSPTLGRPLEPSDDAVPGGGAVATINYELWTTYFNRSSAAVGKTITLNGKPITIVGVNPPDFTGAGDAHLSPGIMLPLSMQPVLLPQRHGSILNDQDYWWLQIMARSKAGVSPQTAQAALDTLVQAMLTANANPEKPQAIPRLVLADGSRGLNTSARALTEQMYVLMALVGLVLLLACANIASLLLARSAARQREMSIRIALGAGRARILRQMLTESLLLASLGGLAGLAVGYAGRNALPRLVSPSWVQPVLNGHFDQRVFIFTAGISILAGLLFGLAPAWKAIQTNPDLKAPTQTVTSRRKGLGNKLIVSFQVALSTLLIVGATLFVRTLFNLDSIDTGFRTDHLLLFKVQLPPSLYRPPQDVILLRNIEEKLSAIPGVESVTLSAKPLIANAFDTDDFIPLGQPPGDTSHQGEAWTNAVGQSFFSTMGIPIVAGRGFDTTDSETSTKVAVINQTLARKYFPDTDPIGKTFRGYQFVSDAPFQIVGICGDTRYDSLRKQPPSTYYILYHQLPRTDGEMTYEVRTQVTPDSLIPEVRRTVQSVDKDTSLISIRTQTEQIRDTMRQERLFAGLTVSFGLLALLLACIGIYGVMTYTVARRTNEIGIRFALGAQNRTILGMILNEAFRVTLVGVVVGLSVGFMLTRLLRTMLFGLKPDDPIAMISAALLLMVVSLIAAFIPALRASRLEPMQALRRE
jgi:predicted permease